MAFAMQDASPKERDVARAWLAERGLWPPPAPSDAAPPDEEFGSSVAFDGMPPAPPSSRGYYTPGAAERVAWAIEWRVSDLVPGATQAELFTAACRRAREIGYVNPVATMVRRYPGAGPLSMPMVRVTGTAERGPSANPFGDARKAARDFEEEMAAFEAKINADAEAAARKARALRELAEEQLAAARNHRVETSNSGGVTSRTSFLGRDRGEGRGLFGKRKP